VDYILQISEKIQRFLKIISKMSEILNKQRLSTIPDT